MRRSTRPAHWSARSAAPTRSPISARLTCTRGCCTSRLSPTPSGAAWIGRSPYSRRPPPPGSTRSTGSSTTTRWPSSGHSRPTGRWSRASNAANLVKAREKVKNQLDRPIDFPLDFHLKDLDDKPLSLDQFKGKVVLVDFWGTWCGPCREAIPGLVQLYQKNRRRGFEVVGLDYEQGAPDPETARTYVKRFVQDSRIPYRIAMVDESFVRKLNVQAYPTTVLVDRSGKPRLLFSGGGPEALDAIDAATLVLLDEPAPGTAKPETVDKARPR